MPKQYEDYSTNEDGSEHHPAFGTISLHRVSATPGAVLFQSDVRHSEYMRITIHEASRRRELHRDWVHPEKELFEISLSLAQFASFVASGGQGSGVPCTIEYDRGHRPGLNLESRLALTNAAVHQAADKAFENIKAAEAALAEGMANKVGAAERKRLMANLHHAIGNATPNVDFAAKMLAEHAENVIEQSRADIETMVALAQNQQQAIESGE